MSMFSAVERNSIFRLVAGVLHLGNINFDVDANGDYVTGVSAASQHGTPRRRARWVGRASRATALMAWDRVRRDGGGASAGCRGNYFWRAARGAGGPTDLAVRVHPRREHQLAHGPRQGAAPPAWPYSQWERTSSRQADGGGAAHGARGSTPASRPLTRATRWPRPSTAACSCTSSSWSTRPSACPRAASASLAFSTSLALKTLRYPSKSRGKEPRSPVPSGP